MFNRLINSAFTVFVLATSNFVFCENQHDSTSKNFNDNLCFRGRRRHYKLSSVSQQANERIYADDFATYMQRANSYNTSAAWCKAMEAALKDYAASRSKHVWTAITDVIQDQRTRNGTRAVEAWMHHNCDLAMWQQHVELAPYPSCDNASTATSLLNTPSCAGYRTCTKQFVRDAVATPHVAIMMGATAKNVNAPSTSNMALFTLSLPSIAKTVECGFIYTVFVGYDVGDPFYDTPAGRANLTEWFEQHVRQPLHSQGISIQLESVRVDNPSSKPGPVFNVVARRAFDAGADFFYRINDDTLMLTPWTAAFACALCSLGPPYGVVGPVERFNPDFLTHDFVHRTHFAIFDSYYPSELSDWWMDNWISFVYGSARSLRLTSVKVGTEYTHEKRAA